MIDDDVMMHKEKQGKKKEGRFENIFITLFLIKNSLSNIPNYILGLLSIERERDGFIKP